MEEIHKTQQSGGPEVKNGIALTSLRLNVEVRPPPLLRKVGRNGKATFLRTDYPVTHNRLEFFNHIGRRESPLLDTEAHSFSLGSINNLLYRYYF